MFARRTVAFLLSLSICALVSPKTALAQEPADLGKLPSDIADAIQNAAKNDSGHTTVFVVDFKGPQGDDSGLGRELAKELADSLRKLARDLTVLSPSDLKQPLAKLNLREEILSSNALNCYRSNLGVSALVEGDIHSGPAGLELQLDAWMPGRNESVFDKKTTLPMTVWMKDLLSAPNPVPAHFFIDETHIWVRSNQSPTRDSEIVYQFPKDESISQPDCLQCPAPEFSDEAVKAKFQGTVVLGVRVDPDGTLSKIFVLRGLPCGLTDKAIESVRGWTFKPGAGPDGEPVSVEMPVELTFLLY